MEPITPSKGHRMKTCPTCHLPMAPTGSDGRPRSFCSRVCSARGSHVITDPRHAEVDDVVVLRLTHGEQLDSTKGERLVATQTLTRRGWSIAAIADLLRVTPKSVSRYRQQLNRAATRKVA